jgi:hypothetical protein
MTQVPPDHIEKQAMNSKSFRARELQDEEIDKMCSNFATLKPETKANCRITAGSEARQNCLVIQGPISCNEKTAARNRSFSKTRSLENFEVCLEESRSSSGRTWINLTCKFAISCLLSVLSFEYLLSSIFNFKPSYPLIITVIFLHVTTLAWILHLRSKV